MKGEGDRRSGGGVEIRGFAKPLRHAVFSPFYRAFMTSRTPPPLSWEASADSLPLSLVFLLLFFFLIYCRFFCCIFALLYNFCIFITFSAASRVCVPYNKQGSGIRLITIVKKCDRDVSSKPLFIATFSEYFNIISFFIKLILGVLILIILYKL